MASIRTISYRSTPSYAVVKQGNEDFIPFTISDSEFAQDMALLIKGEMSPEEHRIYIARKYRHDF